MPTHQIFWPPLREVQDANQTKIFDDGYLTILAVFKDHSTYCETFFRLITGRFDCQRKCPLMRQLIESEQKLNILIKSLITCSLGSLSTFVTYVTILPTCQVCMYGVILAVIRTNDSINVISYIVMYNIIEQNNSEKTRWLMHSGVTKSTIWYWNKIQIFKWVHCNYERFFIWVSLVWLF